LGKFTSCDPFWIRGPVFWGEGIRNFYQGTQVNVASRLFRVSCDIKLTWKGRSFCADKEITLIITKK
jgi:hypothetical protein